MARGQLQLLAIAVLVFALIYVAILPSGSLAASTHYG